MKMKNDEQQKIFTIFDLLPAGDENAISARDLCQICGVNGRKLRSIISNERENGALILSSFSGGYYRPTTEEELSEYITAMRRRAISTFKVIKSAQKALDTWGQKHMDE